MTSVYGNGIGGDGSGGTGGHGNGRGRDGGSRGGRHGVAAVDGGRGGNSSSSDDDDKHTYGSSETYVHIEHSQFVSISKKAEEVRDSLLRKLPEINVEINPFESQVGRFVIYCDGDVHKTFISLEDMEDPFESLMDLDMEILASTIANRILDMY